MSFFFRSRPPGSLRRPDPPRDRRTTDGAMAHANGPLSRSFTGLPAGSPVTRRRREPSSYSPRNIRHSRFRVT
jgi:hypothetical protein